MTQLWKKVTLWSTLKDTKKKDLSKYIRMGCWDMLWDFSGHKRQYHMKTLKENRVENHAGRWDGTA
eukprot:10051774-Prorocentrum_lima.AAC.1